MLYGHSNLCYNYPNCDMEVTTDTTRENKNEFPNKILFTDTESSLHIIFICTTYYSS